MIKHKFNKVVTYKGKQYKPVKGILELPVEVESFNPIKEVKKPKKD